MGALGCFHDGSEVCPCKRTFNGHKKPVAMSEAVLQRNVIALCKQLGLLAYHTHDSRRSEAGFPDLVIVGQDGVLFRELKTQTGKVSVDQLHWLTSLRFAGQDADVWRPEHWPDRIKADLATLGGSMAALKPRPTQDELRKKLQKGKAP